MEWCRMGSLAELYGKSRPEWSTLHKLIKDMVTGVDHIHTIGIFHGDIKPENIFVSLDGSDNLRAKIGDLDDFVPLGHGMTNKTNLNTKELVGTLMYLSPERQLDGNDNHPGKRIKRNADIWSLGCTFVYLVTYDIIWFVKPNGESLEVKKHCEGQNTNEKNKVEDVQFGQLKRFLKEGGKPWVPRNLPTEFRTFVKSCLVEDPLHRPNAQKLLNDPYIRSNPETRYIEGVLYQPCMIQLRANNLLPRQEPGENSFQEDNLALNEAWSNSANCAVRFLAHFQAPRFCIADAQHLIHECPKALTPGQPLERKYCDLIRNNMYDLGIKDAFAQDMVNMLLDDEDMQANFTQGLQAVGSSFPDLVKWLNKFEDDHEYVVKVNATWADIQAEIDAGRPVLVMCQSGNARVIPHAKQLLQIDAIPDKVPALSVHIVHGYIATADENRSLYCTSSTGIVHEQDYKNFLKQWDWKPLDDHMEKIFSCGEVYRHSMVYRRKKT